MIKPIQKYKKGRRLEYRVMKELKEKGYYPIRSAGSHGIIDLVGISSKNIVLIQVKSEKPTFKQKKEFASLKVPDNCLKFFVIFGKRGQYKKILV